MTQSLMGLLLYNKPAFLTSFQALNLVKKSFLTKKAGHTGTLDKFASGLLLVLIGRAVKLSPLFLNHSKVYIGEISFGTETDTLDPEGSIIAKGDIPSLSDIEKAVLKFQGNIMQLPPSYSALHIDGQRAYKIAREGREVMMKERPVCIHELKILSYDAPILKIRAHVSSGTYIRSLARDIAVEAGSRAHLSSLTRIGIDAFSLEDAIDADSLKAAMQSEVLKYLNPLNTALFNTINVPVLYVKDKKSFFHGKALEKLFGKEELSVYGQASPYVAVFSSEDNDFLGYITKENDKWSYGHVFTPA